MLGNYIDGVNTEYTWEGGDVPNLSAGFVAPDTCHALHARIAELEAERAIDTYMPCGHARRYIYSANERAEITTSTCIMCALQSANARIAELERERDAAQARIAEYEGDDKRWHSYETVQAIVKERDELRAQLDAALVAKAQAEAAYDSLKQKYKIAVGALDYLNDSVTDIQSMDNFLLITFDALSAVESEAVK